MEYILNVRSFFVLLYKEVSVKYILRLPHYGNRSFAVALDDILPPSSPRVQIFTFVQDDTLPSYTRIMESAVRRSPLVYVVRLIEDTRSP